MYVILFSRIFQKKVCQIEREYELLKKLGEIEVVICVWGFDTFYFHEFYFSELYEYCLKEKIADQNLIAKWKKQGYENLCCLRCIQTRDTNFSTNCICRVPKTKLEEGKIVECVHCGCRGCSG